MRLSNQNKIVVGVIALILALTVGYAIFSETLNIGGTASASGEFSLIFIKKGEIKEVGSHGATADIINNNKTLDISVPALEYPSAYVEIPVTIKNAGTIDAILKGITTKGLTNDDITVTYSGIEKDEIIRVNEEKEMKIKVKWNESSTTSMSTLEDFNIELVYEQVTGENGGGGANPDLPAIEPIKLGDNVYLNYDNGDVRITGTGDMWMEGTCEFMGETMDMPCPLGIALENKLKTLEPYSIQVANFLEQHVSGMDEDIKNNMIRFPYIFGFGGGYETLGGTKEEFKEILTNTIENGGLGLTNEEADELIAIFDSVPVIIKSITINEGVTSLRIYFFEGIGVDTIRIPDSVISIEGYTFHMNSINTVYLGKGLTTLPGGMFEDGAINNIIIPEGVTKLERYSIFYISGLKTLTIPSTVTEIEYGAIEQCKDLEEIVNKTGRSFDWNDILTGTSGEAFETGTVVNNNTGKTITITK